MIDKWPWRGPVVDLGAGGYSSYYQPHFKNVEYVRLDIVNQPQGGIDIIADVMNMPRVLSNSYGVALLCETLEHLPDPLAAFKETARILRPGGLLICTTVACWTEHRHPKDYWRFLPDGLRYLCEKTNLGIYDIRLEPNDSTAPAHCMVTAYK